MTHMTHCNRVETATDLTHLTHLRLSSALLDLFALLELFALKTDRKDQKDRACVCLCVQSERRGALEERRGCDMSRVTHASLVRVRDLNIAKSMLYGLDYFDYALCLEY